MPPRRTNDPKHWRDRAAQMRALALTMTDSEKTAAAQSAVWMKIGQELRACYEVPQDLPPEMLALLMQLNDRREEK
jgi:hypothetical protein